MLIVCFYIKISWAMRRNWKFYFHIFFTIFSYIFATYFTWQFLNNITLKVSSSRKINPPCCYFDLFLIIVFIPSTSESESSKSLIIFIILFSSFLDITNANGKAIFVNAWRRFPRNKSYCHIFEFVLCIILYRLMNDLQFRNLKLVYLLIKVHV